eukprot:1032644-Rhodomonas_salina.1
MASAQETAVEEGRLQGKEIASQKDFMTVSIKVLCWLLLTSSSVAKREIAVNSLQCVCFLVDAPAVAGLEAICDLQIADLTCAVDRRAHGSAGECDDGSKRDATQQDRRCKQQESRQDVHFARAQHPLPDVPRAR